GAAGRGRGAGAGVGGAGAVAVRAAVGVVEAGVRVGGRRIELVREVDRGRRALGSRAVVAEAGGRVDVGDLDSEGLGIAAAVGIADGHVDCEGVRAVGVGVRLWTDRDVHGRARTRDLVRVRRGAVAPVDRDRPGAVGARVGEGAETEGVAL